MATVNVCETFESIQGESSRAGLPCFFVRLAECNLRCSYCDTAYAYEKGRDIPITQITEECAACKAPLVQITGGEPLLQEGFRELAKSLLGIPGKTVLTETNGSIDISIIPEGVVTIMDIKCPGSGEDGAMDLKNITRLRPVDETKFTLSDRADYDWAKAFVREHDLASACSTVLFSPVHGTLDAKELGKWILDDGLPVRLQLQLHKILEIK